MGIRIESVQIDCRVKHAVSLRLPSDIVREVEAYAFEHDMCKTDAYVH